jgi:hypothetical protein
MVIILRQKLYAVGCANASKSHSFLVLLTHYLGVNFRREPQQENSLGVNESLVVLVRPVFEVPKSLKFHAALQVVAMHVGENGSCISSALQDSSELFFLLFVLHVFGLAQERHGKRRI